MPKKSALQFTTPKLESFIFEDNSDYVTEATNNATGVKMQLHITETAEDRVTEILSVSIGGKTVPYELKVSMSADFLMQDVDEENKRDFLRVNAPSLIFSYVRPLVSQLTAISKYETVTLPFFDFTNHPLEPRNESDLHGIQ